MKSNSVYNLHVMYVTVTLTLSITRIIPFFFVHHYSNYSKWIFYRDSKTASSFVEKNKKQPQLYTAMPPTPHKYSNISPFRFHLYQTTEFYNII